jgi:hypothetical protein
MTDSLSHTDDENKALLNFIFEDSDSVLTKLAPEGWCQSNQVLFFHPTAQQQYDEHVQLISNLNSLRKDKVLSRESTIHDFKQDDLSEIDSWYEFTYLMGLCSYDIFSNNHEVMDSQGVIFDLGSMRGAGSFIADFLNERVGSFFDYMDFYMGTIWVNRRGDLTPYYTYVFKRLKLYGCDWKYSFPRMMTFRFDSLKTETDMTTYNPEKSMSEELEKKQQEREAEEFQEKLDGIYREEYEEAKYKPLPPLIVAYKTIYGKMPDGYPQIDL